MLKQGQVRTRRSFDSQLKFLFNAPGSFQPPGDLWTGKGAKRKHQLKHQLPAVWLCIRPMRLMSNGIAAVMPLGQCKRTSLFCCFSLRDPASSPGHAAGLQAGECHVLGCVQTCLWLQTVDQRGARKEKCQ